MTNTHTLKTWETYWDAVASGKKTFEVRRNDRGFQTGDILVLRRTDKLGFFNPTADGVKDITFRISYLLQGGQFGIEPQFCVLGLEPVSDGEGE